MDLKQIVRAAVNRWRNKSFSPNETASEPTSTQTGITVSTETPATTVVTLTVSGTNEPPRVFTVTGEQYWFSKEEETEIQLANQPFYRSSPAEEVIRFHFRAPKEGEASRLYSLPELAEKLRQLCPGQTTEIKLRALAQSLVSAGIQRIHTSAGNRYRVVEINA